MRTNLGFTTPNKERACVGGCRDLDNLLQPWYQRWFCHQVCVSSEPHSVETSYSFTGPREEKFRYESLCSKLHISGTNHLKEYHFMSWSAVMRFVRLSDDWEVVAFTLLLFLFIATYFLSLMPTLIQFVSLLHCCCSYATFPTAWSIKAFFHLKFYVFFSKSKLLQHHKELLPELSNYRWQIVFLQ